MLLMLMLMMLMLTLMMLIDVDAVVADAAGLPQVFDALKARLQESNSKVNLRALEALQTIVALLRDSLAPVLNLLIPAVVDNHLNSKNHSISTAALGAVQALMHNIGAWRSLGLTDLSGSSVRLTLTLCFRQQPPAAALLLQSPVSERESQAGPHRESRRSVRTRASVGRPSTK